MEFPLRTDCALNIILIGMPGAGKSTVGVLLAKRLGYHFADSDLLLQARQERRLQEIIVADGLPAFMKIEEGVLCGLAGTRTVFATGGSAVYSDRAMRHLRALGQVVFIDIPVETLEKRVRDMDSRGVVIDPGETYTDLYQRRLPLYRQYADLSIDGQGCTADEIAKQIEQHVCGTEFQEHVQ
ncbi:MAG: shikimate kinase [Desulfuromonadales bacterium]|nr:shikimate kinase [Desulfuromonadales bacterium]